MKERLESLQANLDILRRFNAEHPVDPKIPENIFVLTVDGSPSIGIHCSIAPDEDGVQKILSFAGDTYGRDDWESELDVWSKCFNWQKKLDGVRITIFGAQKMPKFEKAPVPPNAFPLLLGE